MKKYMSVICFAVVVLSGSAFAQPDGGVMTVSVRQADAGGVDARRGLGEHLDHAPGSNAGTRRQWRARLVHVLDEEHAVLLPVADLGQDGGAGARLDRHGPETA